MHLRSHLAKQLSYCRLFLFDTCNTKTQIVAETLIHIVLADVFSPFCRHFPSEFLCQSRFLAHTLTE